MKRIVYGALIVIAALALGAMALYMVRSYNQPAPVFRSIVDETKLAALPQKDASGIDTSHLAEGVTPPTNKWFSGLALQQIPKTVFPTPLSFTPTDNSFTFDLPSVTTNPSTITTTVRQPIRVSVEGATYYVVTRYDEVSVDLTYYRASNVVGTVTLVAGLPYVYYTALGDGTLTVDGGASSASVKDDTLTFRTKDTQAALLAYDGAHVKDDSRTITVPKGASMTMYAGATDLMKTLSQYARNRVEGATVTYKKDGDNFQTVIAYKTINGQQTYYGRLPHQQGSSSGTTYDTIYGQLTMQAGKSLTFTTPSVPVIDSLDVSKINSNDRTLLVQTLRQEINAPHTYPDDSYFGSKAMYRDAQLLVLAKELGENEVATTVQTKLHDGLTKWFQQNGTGAKSFYYDTKIHGIVGVTASFGSETFNDHHFHFGYFIYAAGILARYDTEFRGSYEGQVNLLVADIANYRSDEKLPLRRGFDSYFGHSWASGDSPFADGNNQESSSEAINAWIGLDEWARQINNADLVSEAGWMLSNEAAATSAYWLNFDSSKAPYSNGFAHSIVSLNWGGKRDYATWFSPDPRAMLGIQLIPMSPTMQYMSKYGDRITKEVKEAQSNGAPAQFDDYILMYKALDGNSNGLLDEAKRLPDTLIDDANSRSYLYAWIMSRQ